MTTPATKTKTYQFVAGGPDDPFGELALQAQQANALAVQPPGLARPAWMTDAQYTQMTNPNPTEAGAAAIRSSMLGGLTEPANLQMLPGGKEAFATIANIAGLQPAGGGALINVAGKTVEQGAIPLPGYPAGTAAGAKPSPGEGEGGDAKKLPVVPVTNTGMPTVYNSFTTPAYKPTVEKFTPKSFAAPANLSGLLKPLDESQQLGRATLLANLQVDPQLQALQRQQQSELLNAQQTVDELFGPAFDRAVRNIEAQREQARERQVGVTNAQGKLFSPVGRGEIYTIEQPFNQEIADLNYQRAFQAGQIADQFRLANQQVMDQISQLEAKRGQLTSAEAEQLRQLERDFAFNETQRQAAQFNAEQQLALAAAQYNTGADIDVARLMENARQFGLDFGLKNEAQSALLPLQTRGLELGNTGQDIANKTANQRLYEADLAFKTFGLQPQQLEIDRQGLQNQLLGLQATAQVWKNSLDSATTEIQKQTAQANLNLLNAQIGNINSEITKRSQLAPEQTEIGTTVGKAALSIADILGSPNLNSAQKQGLVSGIVAGAAAQTKLPRSQVSAMLGIPDPGADTGGFYNNPPPEPTPQGDQIAYGLYGSFREALQAINPSESLARTKVQVRLEQFRRDITIPNIPEATRQRLLANAQADVDSHFAQSAATKETAGATASRERENAPRIARLRSQIETIDAYLANPTEVAADEMRKALNAARFWAIPVQLNPSAFEFNEAALRRELKRLQTELAGLH